MYRMTGQPWLAGIAWLLLGDRPREITLVYDLRGDPAPVRVDVRRDKHGEYFDVRRRSDVTVDVLLRDDRRRPRLAVDPRVDALRRDPRFTRLLSRIDAP